MILQTYDLPDPLAGPVFPYPLRIYTGLLGQVGDIVMFSATLRRLKQLFPASHLTCAVSARYREAGELLAGLPYVDRLFVTQLYFEKLTPPFFQPWERGWPVDLRGDDEVIEQRRHDLILETRPRSRHTPWWEYAHHVEELAHMVGVPGPIDLRTEICIPPGTTVPDEARGKIVLHNDPQIDPRKAWPWEQARGLVKAIGPHNVVVLGSPGPALAGVLDLRGKTTLAQAAMVIGASACYVGIDSGLMWIAGSLQAPAVGLYGTDYIPAYQAIQPVNPRALYLQAEGSVDSISCRTVVEAVDQVLSRSAPI